MPKHDQPTEEADLLTTREVARMLRVDHTTVRRWIKSGAMEAITLPRGGYRVRRATVDAILYPEAQTKEQPTEANR